IRSVFRNVFMLFVIWLFRRYNSLAQMIVSLTVAAFFDSVAYVMGEDHPEGALCTFQAWWLTYFPYHVLAWGVPLLMSCLPLFTGYYGPAGPWWITDNHVAWRFGWYIPLFSLIFLMICCYVRIIYVANKRMQSWFGTFNPDRERRKVSLGEEIKPLKWYPSVYLLVSLFPLINIHNALYPRTPVFSLTLMHVFSGPLHGLANAVVFGLDRDIWGQLSLTGLQLALHSRLCDHTRIGEYHPGSVRYAPAGELDLSDSDEDDTNVLFYSPDMALKDRGP
uniref:Si:dkey-100n23.5 n=1 Tax=Paramormyrops kingsleyae TaxID=1676925 RepID=A0A3B3QCW0_9TELE